MLSIGANKIKALYLGENEIQRAYLGGNLIFKKSKPSRLPERYTEVQYISNPNLTYIWDFGTPLVTFNNNYRTELDIELDFDKITSKTYFIFGNYLMYYTGNFPSRSYAIYNTISCGKDTSDNLIHLYIQYGYTAGSITVPGLNSFVLNNGRLNIIVDIPKSIISVNDYVPCINPDGTVGIYDIVNNKFYTSYDTAKVFVAGPAA